MPRLIVVFLTVLLGVAACVADEATQSTDESPPAVSEGPASEPTAAPPVDSTAEPAEESGSGQGVQCRPPDDDGVVVCELPSPVLGITPEGVVDIGGETGLEVLEVTATGIEVAPAPLPAPRPASADAIPDAHVSTAAGGLRAWVAGPTQRYGHGILGDEVEGTRLAVAVGDRTVHFDVSDAQVIEDLRPRFADVDGDGDEEVLVVLTELDAGASLAVVDVDANGARLMARTDPIGTPNRWLNPLPPADVDGDGDQEVAAVETPHIGGVLKVWDLRDGSLELIASAPGFSNHEIGSTVQDLAVVLGSPGAAAWLVPRDGRDRLSLVSADDPGNRLGLYTLPAPVHTAMVEVPGGVVVGVASGQLVAIPNPLD